MPLGTEIGLGPGHIVLDGDPAPLPTKMGQSPQFSAHVYCGQTAEWIKIPRGTEVGLGPGDFVLNEDPAPLPTKPASNRSRTLLPMLLLKLLNAVTSLLSYTLFIGSK